MVVRRALADPREGCSRFTNSLSTDRSGL